MLRKIIKYDAEKIELQFIQLEFEEIEYRDVFFRKNNKTLGETLEHRRYHKLKNRLSKKYDDQMKEPLGCFLNSLKSNGDESYKWFLNEFGDLEYSNFWIKKDDEMLEKKGIYAYYLEDKLVYIGRCRDSMRKRVNQGYGRIAPKNCYLDGQSTNCHLNSLITRVRNHISLWMFPETEDEEIIFREKQLIKSYKPEWNIQLS